MASKRAPVLPQLEVVEGDEAEAVLQQTSEADATRPLAAEVQGVLLGLLSSDPYPHERKRTFWILAQALGMAQQQDGPPAPEPLAGPLRVLPVVKARRPDAMGLQMDELAARWKKATKSRSHEEARRLIHGLCTPVAPPEGASGVSVAVGQEAEVVLQRPNAPTVTTRLLATRQQLVGDEVEPTTDLVLTSASSGFTPTQSLDVFDVQKHVAWLHSLSAGDQVQLVCDSVELEAAVGAHKAIARVLPGTAGIEVLAASNVGARKKRSRGQPAKQGTTVPLDVRAPWRSGATLCPLDGPTVPDKAALLQGKSCLRVQGRSGNGPSEEDRLWWPSPAEAAAALSPSATSVRQVLASAGLGGGDITVGEMEALKALVQGNCEAAARAQAERVAEHAPGAQEDLRQVPDVPASNDRFLHRGAWLSETLAFAESMRGSLPAAASADPAPPASTERRRQRGGGVCPTPPTGPDALPLQQWINASFAAPTSTGAPDHGALLQGHLSLCNLRMRLADGAYVFDGLDMPSMACIAQASEAAQQASREKAKIAARSLDDAAMGARAARLRDSLFAWRAPQGQARASAGALQVRQPAGADGQEQGARGEEDEEVQLLALGISDLPHYSARNQRPLPDAAQAASKPLPADTALLRYLGTSSGLGPDGGLTAEEEQRIVQASESQLLEAPSGAELARKRIESIKRQRAQLMRRVNKQGPEYDEFERTLVRKVVESASLQAVTDKLVILAAHLALQVIEQSPDRVSALRAAAAAASCPRPSKAIAPDPNGTLVPRLLACAVRQVLQALDGSGTGADVAELEALEQRIMDARELAARNRMPAGPSVGNKSPVGAAAQWAGGLWPGFRPSPTTTSPPPATATPAERLLPAVSEGLRHAPSPLLDRWTRVPLRSLAACCMRQLAASTDAWSGLIASAPPAQQKELRDLVRQASTSQALRVTVKSSVPAIVLPTVASGTGGPPHEMLSTKQPMPVPLDSKGASARTAREPVNTEPKRAELLRTALGEAFSASLEGGSDARSAFDRFAAAAGLASDVKGDLQSGAFPTEAMGQAAWQDALDASRGFACVTLMSSIQRLLASRSGAAPLTGDDPTAPIIARLRMHEPAKEREAVLSALAGALRLPELARGLSHALRGTAESAQDACTASHACTCMLLLIQGAASDSTAPRLKPVCALLAAALARQWHARYMFNRAAAREDDLRMASEEREAEKQRRLAIMERLSEEEREMLRDQGADPRRVDWDALQRRLDDEGPVRPPPAPPPGTAVTESDDGREQYWS